MPIQGQLKGKIPTQQRDKSRVAGEAPNADISAGVSQQTQEITQDEIPELIRKNSAILENLNLMYETIHNETQLLKTLKQETTTKEEPPIFEKKQEEPQQVTPQQNDVLRSGSMSPDADKSARVLEPKRVIKKTTLQQNNVLRSSSERAPTDLKSPGVSKSMIPLLKKKPNQPAPALLPRWR